jgi:dihydrofolate reductase
MPFDVDTNPLPEVMMMGRIKAHEFVALDGVAENPSWTADFPFDPKMGAAIGEVVGTCTAILLGRTTYEMFAPAWSTRTAEDDPGAPFFNESRKYIVSQSLTDADWNNSTVIGAYDPEVIRELKERDNGDLYVSGSLTLVRALIADSLLDELHLFVYPVALGSGQKLFIDAPSATRFSVGAAERYDNGVVHLEYRPSS